MITPSNKDNLYSGIYSDKSQQERIRKTGALLEKYISNPSQKSILEIGAGHGNNVIMFRDFGFKNQNIFLNEIRQDRIEAIRTNYPEIILFEGNALEVDFGQKFDCIYQSTVFTSILSDDDRKNLAARMWDMLKPGGIILWYDFIFNNPNNPDVKKVSIDEVKKLFPNASEVEIKRVTLAPPIGRKVRGMYALFNFPFLRSHILAVFKK